MFWEPTEFISCTARGIYRVTRDSWREGYELSFRPLLKGWPNSDSVKLCPPADNDGNATEWGTLAQAMGEAAAHDARFAVQVQRAAGQR